MLGMRATTNNRHAGRAATRVYRAMLEDGLQLLCVSQILARPRLGRRAERPSTPFAPACRNTGHAARRRYRISKLRSRGASPFIFKRWFQILDTTAFRHAAAGLARFIYHSRDFYTQSGQQAAFPVKARGQLRR